MNEHVEPANDLPAEDAAVDSIELAADTATAGQKTKLAVPASATREEAAAIAAAIGAHLSAEARAQDESAAEDQVDRWTIAGRIETMTGTSPQLPPSGPADPWTIAGRCDRS